MAKRGDTFRDGLSAELVEPRARAQGTLAAALHNQLRERPARLPRRAQLLVDVTELRSNALADIDARPRGLACSASSSLIPLSENAKVLRLSNETDPPHAFDREETIAAHRAARRWEQALSLVVDNCVRRHPRSFRKHTDSEWLIRPHLIVSNTNLHSPLWSEVKRGAANDCHACYATDIDRPVIGSTGRTLRCGGKITGAGSVSPFATGLIAAGTAERCLGATPGRSNPNPFGSPHRSYRQGGRAAGVRCRGPGPRRRIVVLWNCRLAGRVRR